MARPSREASRQGRADNRVPVGHGNKLAFNDNDPNYMYRMVNDVPGRIAMFQRAGYEFVYNGERELDKGTAEAGAPDTRASVDAGQGLRQYRMRIRKELYDEDQASKFDKVKELENSMKNKNPNPVKGEYAGLTDE